MFADMYYQYSISIPAQLAVAYHVNRLQGIRSSINSCWPPQRCPRFFISNDDEYQVPSSTLPSIIGKRKQIDNDGGRAGLMGIKHVIALVDLAEIQSMHRISAPVLFKAACALLTSHLTGSTQALFANTQAGRQWPFMDTAITSYLPNPITITGNKLNLVLNRIAIPSSCTTTGEFLQTLEDEQHLLTTHAHAPVSSIMAQLSPADAAAFVAGRRQLLNWNPVMAAGGAVNDDGGAKEGSGHFLKFVSIEGYTDVMLEWHCGMVNRHTASLAVQWDGCQAGKGEVRAWAEGFIRVLRWVLTLENWDKEVASFAW